MNHSIRTLPNAYNTLGTYDQKTGIYYEFTIPCENEDIRINKKVEYENRGLIRLIKTAFNQYIALNRGGEGESMFILADSTGKTINTFFEYPYKNKDERERFDNRTRFFAYQGSIATNPSKTKFAYAAYYGDLIHFYSIGNNTIQSIAKIENEYPLYNGRNSTIQGGVMRGVMFSPECLSGYINIYATEQFVYALFNGTKLEDRKFDEGSILRIFDWNGNLIKVYDLDIPSNFLCISDDDSKIWTIAVEPDISLVYFDL